MRPRLTRRRTLGLLAAGVALPTLGVMAKNRNQVRTLTWDDLVPKDWDPVTIIKNKQLNIFDDADPRAKRAMRQMRELWDTAPTVDALEGVQGKLPGYVVPLEFTEGDIKELLLVPYFGACIHSPPPPANQIVHVTLARAQKVRSMDTVWVTGTLRVKRGDSPWGKSGYAFERASIEIYKTP